MTTLFEDLWHLWKQYVDFSVVENHELKEIMFHVFLGVVLTNKGYTYMESGMRKSVRLHLFMIQDSGTGKSQLMKAYNTLLISLGIKARLTVTDNVAALTGTTYFLDPFMSLDKKEKEDKKDKENGGLKERAIKIRKGLLSELLALTWDEGSALLQGGAFMKNMTDVFQVVMDEPGRVSKGMRLGTIEYPTNTTLVAGSYMFPEFKDTLLKKGFLQRMFIFFKQFSSKEKRNLRIGVNLLKKRKNPEKLRQLEAAMKLHLSRIPDLPGKNVTFNDNDILNFNTDLEDIYIKFIDKSFGGEKQTVLETFYSRLHSLIDKIATQRAMILGKVEVDNEDLQYAKTLSMKHIDSLLRLFDYLVGGELTTVPEHREIILTNIIIRSGGSMVQKELLDELKKIKKIGKWDLGFNRTLSFINELINKNKLKSSKGKKGEKLIFI